MRAKAHRNGWARAWRRLALPLLAVAGLTGGQSALAQDGSGPAPSVAMSGPDAQELQPVVDRIIGAMVGREAVPGAIVGVSWHGRRSYFGYGGTGGAPYAPDTIVEISSITKVFTTALFVEAVKEGRMQPDAPIQSYMPDRKLFPCIGQVTPLQLADFTSGMPELPGNVPRPLAERGIEHYTKADFLDWVAHWRPGDGDGCALPAPYRYSNASVGLLGYLVADRLGTSWADLVRERITGPLRMTSTAMKVATDKSGLVAQGYGPEGNPVIPWPVFAWFPAGALRSSASDMLAFGEAALGHDMAGGAPVPPPLAQALREAMVPIYQPEGRDFAQGMAWVQDPGDPERGLHPVYYKAGGTDGFNSVIVVNPAKDLTIFIAASRRQSGIPRLGVTLSRQIRSRP